MYYYVVINFAQIRVQQYLFCLNFFFFNVLLLSFVLTLNIIRSSYLLTIIMFLRAKSVVLTFVSRARFIISFFVVVIILFIFSLLLIKIFILNSSRTLSINNVAFALSLKESRVNNSTFLLIILI